MTTAILLSGGTGSRLDSDIPKQYIQINNMPIIMYSLCTIQRCELIQNILVVCEPKWEDEISTWAKEYGITKLRGFAVPGENRQLSIFSALKSLISDISENDTVIIHDAARPLVSEETINTSIRLLSDDAECEGVLPVLPMKDTVYMANDAGSVEKMLPREKLFAGQAPESFRFGKYLKANEALLPDAIKGINGSSEPAMLYGMKIKTIPGDENNFKITTTEDLKRFESICSSRNK